MIEVLTPVWHGTTLWLNSGIYKGRDFNDTHFLVHIDPRTVTLVKKDNAKQVQL